MGRPAIVPLLSAADLFTSRLRGPMYQPLRAGLLDPAIRFSGHTLGCCGRRRGAEDQSAATICWKRGCGENGLLLKREC